MQNKNIKIYIPDLEKVKSNECLFPDPQFLNQKLVFSCLVAQKRWDFLLFLIVNNWTLRLSSNFNQIHDYFAK